VAGTDTQRAAGQQPQQGTPAAMTAGQQLVLQCRQAASPAWYRTAAETEIVNVVFAS